MRDLQGAWNFRDVADTTGVLRPGRLFRSGELSELGDEGRDELRRLGVTDVADLRSRSEVLRHGPGLVPDGVEIHLLPIPDLPPDEVNPDGEAPHEHAFKRLLEDKPNDEPVSDAATRYMVEEYSRFPTYPGAREALHRVVNLLADGRTVLAHCFAGKDRTGFTIALVLEAAGVDRAIQVHGAAGVSEDTVLARMYAWQRAMRIFDGPDEVHMRSIARAEIGREKSTFAAAVT